MLFSAIIACVLKFCSEEKRLGDYQKSDSQPEFGAIRKETVEPQVCFELKIFENKNLVDVKIADIQIEKVQKP